MTIETSPEWISLWADTTSHLIEKIPRYGGGQRKW